MILGDTDSGKVSVLVLLDLSAAFDTGSQYIVEQVGNLGRTQRNSPRMVQVLLGRAELFCDHWKLSNRMAMWSSSGVSSWTPSVQSIYAAFGSSSAEL